MMVTRRYEYEFKKLITLYLKSNFTKGARTLDKINDMVSLRIKDKLSEYLDIEILKTPTLDDLIKEYCSKLPKESLNTDPIWAYDLESKRNVFKLIKLADGKYFFRLVKFLDGYVFKYTSKQAIKFNQFKLLQTGAFGEVYSISDDYVVKNIKLKNLSRDDRINIAKEIILGQYLICSDCNEYAGVCLALFYESSNNIELYMKRYNIDLFDYITSGNGILDNLHTKEMINSVRNLHRMGVIHFDIKMENFLCNIDESTKTLKQIVLADFGLADFKESVTKFNSVVKGSLRHLLTKQFYQSDIFEKYPEITDIYATATTILICKDTNFIELLEWPIDSNGRRRFDYMINDDSRILQTIDKMRSLYDNHYVGIFQDILEITMFCLQLCICIKEDDSELSYTMIDQITTKWEEL